MPPNPLNSALDPRGLWTDVRRIVSPRLLLLTGILAFLPRGLAAEADVLTRGEREWLAAHPQIRFGYDPDWPPFSFRSPDGHLIGIDADLLTLLSRRLGLQFKIAARADWKAAYAAAQAREIDVLLSTVWTPERAGYFQFSRPYLAFPMAIVSRDDSKTAWSISRLNGKRVAVVADYAITSRLKAESPGALLVIVQSGADSFRTVSQGLADVAVTNLANATFLIQTQGYTNLRVAGLAPDKSEMCYAVRSDWPELVDILNRGIATLTPAEIRAINNRWIKVGYAPAVRWDLLWKVGGPALALALALIAAIGYHNRRLARELAARIRLQTEIEAARDQLKRLNDDKVWLMEMAAHDLRSPLTAMQLLSDLSLKGKAIPAAEALAQLEPQISRMLALLNKLFDVHAIEEGRRPLDSRPLDLGPLAIGAADALQGLAETKQIRVQATGLQNGWKAVGDEVAIRQVVENLLSNALKFSPAGGVVEVSLQKIDQTLSLAIRDHGPGVPESERSRIFGKYAQGSAKPTAGEKSTGLGLAIARSLVEAMGGTIRCEAANPGARFIIVLPAA
jgi:two-component system sensor histidine kinase EvgS